MPLITAFAFTLRGVFFYHIITFFLSPLLSLLLMHRGTHAHPSQLSQVRENTSTNLQQTQQR